MPDIKDSVGHGGTNAGHDVAMVQALLQIVKNAKGHPYLTTSYDGTYAVGTKTAIIAFQKDQKLVPVAVPAPVNPAVKGPAPIKGPAAPVAKGPTEKEGFVGPSGPTIQKLNAMLPLPYKAIRIINDTKVVYWPGSANDATASAKAIRGDVGLEASFRQNVTKLVEIMFQRHEIVLSLPTTGGLRTFQKQYDLVTQPNPPTQAGPGESNHNFGLAVDIGLKHFKWLGAHLMAKTEAGWWLDDLTKVSGAKALSMWAARNLIAFNQLKMNPSALPGDHIHIQKFSDSNVSMRRSLAYLLDQVGAFYWKHAGGQYTCDLGLGGAFYNVGTSVQIWSGNATVTQQSLAAAYQAAKQAGPVTPALVAQMKADLKADFVTAEANRFQWVPKQ